MLTQKQVSDLNRMNVAAQRVELGDILKNIPIVETHIIVSSNISGGVVTVLLDNKIGAVSSFIVFGQGGIKNVTTFEYLDNTFVLASADIVANDNLIVTYIPKYV